MYDMIKNSLEEDELNITKGMEKKAADALEDPTYIEFAITVTHRESTVRRFAKFNPVPLGLIMREYNLHLEA